MIRDCIESVKQNKYSKEIENKFLNLINQYDNCILGCTELPILYEKYKEKITCKRVYDPVLLALKRLKEEYEND